MTMREIKFRAKDFHTGIWHYGCLVYKERRCTMLERVGEGSGNAFVGFPCHSDTIGQYTGLKDKNGKEIYEGDIVDVAVSSMNYIGKDPTPYHRICVCVYQKEYASFIYERVGKNYKRKLSRNWKYKVMGSYDIQCVEVLGNIHDNPELLEQE